MRHVLAAKFGVPAVAAIVLAARDAGPARATGIGPNIELGTPVGLTAPVLATTAAVDPYSGFNIHVTTNASAGVSVSTLSFSAAGIIIGEPGEFFCTQATPKPDDRIIGCVNIAGGAVVSTGLLATLVVAATGDGCVYVGLISVPGDTSADTYTVNAANSSAQSNVVGLTPVYVLVGTGIVADCPGPTHTPTPTTTPTVTDTPTITPTPHTGPGIGPDIAIAASATDTSAVEVSAANAAVNPFVGYNLHLAWNASGGSSKPFGLGHGPGPALGGGFACGPDQPNKPSEFILSCFGTDGAVAGPGLLARFHSSRAATAALM